MSSNVRDMENRELLREYLSHVLTTKHLSENKEFPSKTLEGFQRAISDREQYIDILKFEILKRMESYKDLQKGNKK